jgi:hypothetical protein
MDRVASGESGMIFEAAPRDPEILHLRQKIYLLGLAFEMVGKRQGRLRTGAPR